MFDLPTYSVYLSLLFFVMILTYAESRKLCPLDGIHPKFSFYNYHAILLISFVVGFRYQVGVDWLGYKEYFEFLKENEGIRFNQQNCEIIYFYLNKIFVYFDFSYTAVFFVVALLSWSFIFSSIPKNILPLVVFFLFVDEQFFWSMNGVRQFAAVSIFLFSIRFIENKNLLAYISLIVFAAGFHVSALLLIPLYFIPYKKLQFGRGWLVLYIASLQFGGFGSKYIEDVFAWAVTRIKPFQHYVWYLENERFIAREISYGFGYVFKVFIALIIFWYAKKLVKNSPNVKIYCFCFFVGSIGFNLLHAFQLFGRLNVYFLMTKAFLLAFLVTYLHSQNNTRIISIGIVVLYFFLFLVTIYNSSNLCSPYSFSFS